jgi:hypothetical protein
MPSVKCEGLPRSPSPMKQTKTQLPRRPNRAAQPGDHRALTVGREAAEAG